MSPFPREVFELGHGGGGLLIEEREVDFLVRHAAGPALDPACALGVFVNAVAALVGAGCVAGFEGPGLLDGVAMRGEEGCVAASAYVIERGEQKERGGVGRGVHVGKLEPVDGRGGLRILVHDLAVGALAADEEFEFGFGEREVAVAVDGIEGVERVAAKEPAEARAGRVARSVITGHEGGFVIPGLRSETLRRARAGSGAPALLGMELWPGMVLVLSCSMEMTAHWKASLSDLSGVSMETESARIFL